MKKTAVILFMVCLAATLSLRAAGSGESESGKAIFDKRGCGTCSLTDGSVAGDWRLANRFELESLLDLENWRPALPTGHPFTAPADWYWSSTTYGPNVNNAYYVNFNAAHVGSAGKDQANGYSWCVRGGQ